MGNAFENEERYRIGEVAELFDVSARTLRLYHDLGIFVPQQVDAETGYRYYSRIQFNRLEKILQLKSMGLSLKQIKCLIDDSDMSVFESLIGERIRLITQRIEQDTTQRELLVHQLRGCTYLRTPPKYDEPFIEFYQPRTGYLFEMEPYYLREFRPETSPWPAVLERIKRSLSKNGLSPFLINQTSGLIEQRNIENGAYQWNAGILIMNHPLPADIPRTDIRGGTYACMYRSLRFDDGDAEADGIDLLCEFIEENGLKIGGDYIGEVITQMSFFDSENVDVLLKLQMPVIAATHM